MKGKIILLLSIFLLGWSRADTLPPMIIHTPAKQAKEGGALNLQAIIIDNEEVAEVLFFYRQQGEQTFHSMTPLKRARTYTVTLSGQALLPPSLEYYWQATDNSNNRAYLPKVSPTTNPFHVVVEPLKGKKKTQVVMPKPIESGNMLLSIESASADFPNNPATLPLALMERRPGKHVQYTANYFVTKGTNFKSYYLFRKIEDYTGRKYDEFRFQDKDKGYERSYGDFYYTISDLSLSNVKLRGALIKTISSSGDFAFFGGRSQIPQEEGDESSAVFRQLTFGLKKKGSLTKSGSWFAHFSRTYDQKSSITTPEDETIRPTENTLLTMATENKWRNFTFKTEEGGNEYDNDIEDNTGAKTDYAGMGTLTYASTHLTLNAMARRIGGNYVTAGTLETYVDNDRLGYKFWGDYKPIKHLTLSLSRERYKNNLAGTEDTTSATTDQSGTFSLDFPSIPSMSFTLSRLDQNDLDDDTNDTVLRNKNITLRHSIPSFSFLGNSSLSFTWQSLDYFANALNFNILYESFGLDTAYKDVLSLSTSYQFTRTREDEEDTLAITHKKVYSAGIQWNLIPYEFNFFLNGKLTRSQRTDGTVDSQERDYKASFVYYFTDTSTITLEGRIVYSTDWADQDNSYNDHILTVKWMRSF